MSKPVKWERHPDVLDGFTGDENQEPGVYGTDYINYVVSRAGLMVLRVGGHAEAARSFDKIYAPRSPATSQAGIVVWSDLVRRYERGVCPLIVLEDEAFDSVVTSILLEFRVRARHEGLSDIPRPVPAGVVYNNRC